MPPPLLPPPQITITFSQITARAIFYSADVRLWHLIPLGLSGEGKGSLQSPRAVAEAVCAGASSENTELEEGKEQQERGSGKWCHSGCEVWTVAKGPQPE